MNELYNIMNKSMENMEKLSTVVKQLADSVMVLTERVLEIETDLKHIEENMKIGG